MGNELQMNCTNCRAEMEDSQNFCSNCGFKRTESTPTPDPDTSSTQSDSTPKKDYSGTKFVFGVIGVIVLLLGFVSVTNDTGNVSKATPSAQQTTKKATTTATPKATRTTVEDWWPDGFRELNYYTAYKPLEDMDCDYSSAHGCYQIYVVTNRDCNLFLDVNFEVDGVVVDDDLDSAVVRAGQQAVMTFASFETPKYSGSKKVRITDVTCY